MTEQELARLYGDEYAPMSADLREQLCYDQIIYCEEYAPDQEEFVHWDRLLGREQSEQPIRYKKKGKVKD